MFNAILKSLITILYENAYTNIIVNQTIKHNHFTDYEKRLYTKIVYGVVEKKMLLDFYLQPLLKGKRVKPFVRNALRVGVYAMDYLKLPVYYVVNEVVGCIKKQDYKASTFVNAILRKYQSQKKPDLSSLTKLKRYSIMYSLPFALTALLYKQYQEQIISFFDEGEEPYNTYRINTLKAKLDDITSFLDQAQINYMVEEDIILQTKTSLIQSPLFQDGLIVAQDKSSMMVPLLLCPSKKEVLSWLAIFSSSSTALTASPTIRPIPSGLRSSTLITALCKTWLVVVSVMWPVVANLSHLSLPTMWTRQPLNSNSTACQAKRSLRLTL